MNDSVQIAIIVAIGPTITGLVAAWVSWSNSKQLKSVHVMVNSGATEQLRVGMISAKALAAATDHPEHIELARVAQDKYDQSIRNSKETA